MSIRDMESLILGSDHRLTDDEMRDYMKFHLRTHPLVSLVVNWLLEHSKEFTNLQREVK